MISAHQQTRKHFSIGFLLLFFALCAVSASAEDRLDVSSETQVSPNGKVHISLHLKNISGQPLYSIHPMFHFHHSMEMGNMIDQMQPGESLTINNDRHPPVVLAGRYPLVVLFHYQTEPNQNESILQTYTGSFHHKEPVESVVGGNIEFVQEGENSKLKIHLNNQSNSLKNVRLMLILPPGLQADKFPGMMTFTLHGGENVYFETGVQHTQSFRSLTGYYPIHLLLEYGEFLKHYTSEIQSSVYFNPIFDLHEHWPHLIAIIFFAIGLALVYKRRNSNLQPESI
jgi:hypothetical protein